MPLKDSSPDRRIVRTREALREALIELILEKGYDATTVSDVVERANVAHSTFYVHHGSKESVLLDGVGSLREILTKAQREASDAASGQASRLAFSLALFEHADGHRDLYQAHMGDRSGAVVINAIRQMLTHLIRREMPEASVTGREPGSVPVEAAIRFITDAFLAVLTWWIGAKPRIPPAEGNRIFRQLIEPVLANNFPPPQAPTK